MIMVHKTLTSLCSRLFCHTAKCQNKRAVPINSHPTKINTTWHYQNGAVGYTKSCWCPTLVQCLCICGGDSQSYEWDSRPTDMAEPWTGATSNMDQHALEHCCIMCVPIMLLCYSCVTDCTGSRLWRRWEAMVVSQLINSQTELKVQYQGRHTN